MSEIAYTLAVGQVLHDRYTVQEMLAQGGMSTIYRVTDRNLPGQWAVKQMAPLQARPEDLASIRAQFRQEAEILTRLRHPGIPRVIDFFSEDSVDYLVEELVPGDTLEHRIDTVRVFTEYESTRVALALLDILEYLHANKIVYRDMKPGNVMVGPDGRVVLVDFGIARLFTPGKSADTVIVGTPGFASPEHYGRGQTDERSDIYSLGATLHQMLTGHDPADSPFSFESPAKAMPGLSAGISDLVMKALDLKPDRRFQSAAAMREALLSTRKNPPARREFTYPPFIGLPAPVVRGGLTGTFLGSVLGTIADPHALLLFPVWLVTLGVGGLVRGHSYRGNRVTLDDEGLTLHEGGAATIFRWEDVREIRVHRTSGIDRTLWGEVNVYASSIDITTSTRVVSLLPALNDWEVLVEWVAYRSGLRLQSGVDEGADEVYRR